MSTCIFCDRPGGSGEHVWTDALRDEMSRLFPAKVYKRSYTAFDVQRSDGANYSDVRAIGGPLWTLKIPAVCTTCNNTWMSRLEERCLPFLRKMVKGESVDLSADQVRYFASWVTLKAMIIEQRRPESAAYLDKDHKSFYLTGLPSTSTEIRIGRCTHKIWQNAVSRQPEIFINPITGLRYGHKAILTWGFGQLLILVEHNSKTHPNVFPIGSTLSLWPRETGLHWPPRFLLSIEQVSKLATRYFPDRASAAESPLNFGDKPRGKHPSK